MRPWIDIVIDQLLLAAIAAAILVWPAYINWCILGTACS